jgi:hypothetical protein
LISTYWSGSEIGLSVKAGGYYDYTRIESVFEMVIPDPDEKLRSAWKGKRSEG